jgi:hypothetical protein
MRRKVALHMLKFKENISYLNNYSQHENDMINITNSSEQNIRRRYVKYAEAHLNNINHWPSELCIHIIARIYNLEIVVLQEQVIPGIGPLGYIVERLRTTGLENATNYTTTATATLATTATVSSSFRHMTPSYIIHDDNLRNALDDQKHIPELIWEDSSNNKSDDEREEMEIFTNSAIPANAASTAASAASAASAAYTTDSTTTAAVAFAASSTDSATTAAVDSAASSTDTATTTAAVDSAASSTDTATTTAAVDSAASSTDNATTAAVASTASTASITATATTAAVASTASATTATTIVSYNYPFIIMIGNRGDQHYYSIGKWLAGQALLIII